MDISKIPIDINGAPAGFWGVALRGSLSDGTCGARFREGRSIEPVSGMQLRHLCAAHGNEVLGAYRCTFEGEPMGATIGEPVGPWSMVPFSRYVTDEARAEAMAFVPPEAEEPEAEEHEAEEPEASEPEDEIIFDDEVIEAPKKAKRRK